MKTVPLSAVQRNETGTKDARKLRVQKRLPAIVYGKGVKTTPIHISLDEFSRAIHTKAGENVIIKLAVTGKEKLEKNVVIKDIQHDPITDGIDHVDFNAISMTEKIKVKIPIHTIGESAGVKEGGVLDVIHHEIEVECLPTEIPERLDVDISQLSIGDSIHIEAIKLPAGVVSTFNPEEVIVAVHTPRVEEEQQPEEGQAEPEVIGKEKKEGEEEQPEEAPKKPAEEAKKSKEKE